MYGEILTASIKQINCLSTPIIYRYEVTLYLPDQALISTYLSLLFIEWIDFRRKSLLLRIMKVIKNHHPQMGMFASYFYKNVLFMLDARNPTASWGRADLANR